MLLCAYCLELFSQPQGSKFCLKCLAAIRSQLIPPHKICRQFEHSVAWSLFSYNPMLRSIIWRIKVHSDLQLMKAFIQLLSDNQLTASLLQSVDALCPVPSSLWSRLRGRFDLPGLWAELLSQLYNKPVIQLSWRAYFWRLRKRALLKPEQKDYHLPQTPHDKYVQSLPGQVLLLDDMITTGYSLAYAKNYIHCQQIHCLTICRSTLGNPLKQC